MPSPTAVQRPETNQSRMMTVVSGHPASSRYRDRVERWSQGLLDTLRVPQAPDGLARERIRSRLTLTGVSR